MFTFSWKKIGGIIAIISDIITITLFINYLTGWTMRDIFCNPYFRMLILAFSITILLFVSPMIDKKVTSLAKKFSVYVLIAVCVSALIFFIPKGNCMIDSSVPAAVTKVDTLDSKKANSSQIKPSPKTNEPAKKTHVLKSKPEIEPAVDQSKTSSKYDLKGARFEGPTQVGDNNTQINQSPVFRPSDTLIQRIEDSARTKNRIIVIKFPNVINNSEFASDVLKALHSRGYINSSINDGNFLWNYRGRGVEVLNDPGFTTVYVHMY